MGRRVGSAKLLHVAVSTIWRDDPRPSPDMVWLAAATIPATTAKDIRRALHRAARAAGSDCPETWRVRAVPERVPVIEPDISDDASVLLFDLVETLRALCSAPNASQRELEQAQIERDARLLLRLFEPAP